MKGYMPTMLWCLESDWQIQLTYIILSEKLCLNGTTKTGYMPTKLFAYMAHTDKVYLYSVLKVMPVWCNQNGCMPKNYIAYMAHTDKFCSVSKTMHVWCN